MSSETAECIVCHRERPKYASVSMGYPFVVLVLWVCEPCSEELFGIKRLSFPELGWQQ